MHGYQVISKLKIIGTDQDLLSYLDNQPGYLTTRISWAWKSGNTFQHPNPTVKTKQPTYAASRSVQSIQHESRKKQSANNEVMGLRNTNEYLNNNSATSVLWIVSIQLLKSEVCRSLHSIVARKVARVAENVEKEMPYQIIPLTSSLKGIWKGILYLEAETS